MRTASETSPIVEHSASNLGRSGEGCAEAQILRSCGTHHGRFLPLPGFRAYMRRGGGAPSARPLPGFEAHSYRDFGHRAAKRYLARHTGISGIPLPGFRAQNYRDLSHTGAGTSGTFEGAATGIPGTIRPGNPAKRLAIFCGNSVFINPCNNTTTEGARLIDGGRGACPRKG